MEDTIFCNDRSTHAYSEFTSEEKTDFAIESTHTTYGPTYRLVKRIGPSVICPNSADAYTKSSTIGNGKLTYSVGLLTSDEIWMAGEGTYYYDIVNVSYKNTTYYLQNGNYWWTMSPMRWVSSNASMWDARATVGLSLNRVSSSRGVRPVISLKPGQKFEYGNGTVNNPYRFVETIS